LNLPRFDSRDTIDRGAARTAPVRARYRLEYLLFRGIVALFSHLPRPFALRLGAGITAVYYVLDGKRRRVGLRNLRIAFPEKTEHERRAILRRSYRNIGRAAAECCHLPKLSPESLGRYVQIDDPQRWQCAVNRPGGAIVITAHFGNWELLACAQGLLGRPVTIIHKPFKNPLVEAAIGSMRARVGTRHIRKPRAARDGLRVLRAGDLLVMPVDQNQKHHEGVFVDLFGIPACTTPGPARLGAHTGVPVVPAFLVRIGESDQHRLVVLPDVELVHTGERAADVVTNTRRCSDVIERMLREHPDQWIWFHHRWRTRPDGSDGFY
jgi:KDO2-lipid IV(A) lauroyltransferase